MVGITSFGAYIPLYRLSREAVAAAWGRTSVGGERSVANNDEDTATMAVEAVFDCLRGSEREEIDGLFFASTTAPYTEKQTAGLVATVADLGEQILTVDYANSRRSCTNALQMAYHFVKGRGAGSILVAASDCRLGYPRSDFEQSFGDGAAAVLIGGTGVVATLEGSYSIVNEMMDIWRNPGDTFVRSWESRWGLGEGYNATLQKAVQGVLKRCELKAQDLDKAILPAPDLRSHRALVKRLGLDPEQVQDPLLATVGDCGTAHPMMMLVGALQGANPGDKVLMAAYGDGADALVFQVTDEIRDRQRQRGITGHISSKLMLPSYERYLSYRGLLETVPGEPYRLLPSATAYWRDRDSILRCYGSRCRQCGTVSYPIQKICYTCRKKDDYETIRLSDRKGKVFTYSLDNLAGRSDDPVVVQTVVEMDEGAARLYCMMTDCVPSDVTVGMPVELTFRRLYEGAGFHHYFWKCRPTRDGGR